MSTEEKAVQTRQVDFLEVHFSDGEICCGTGSAAQERWDTFTAEAVNQELLQALEGLMRSVEKNGEKHWTRIGKLTRRQIDQLLMLGIRMSNVCFNLKQSKDTPEPIRAYMADFQEKWDEVQKK